MLVTTAVFHSKFLVIYLVYFPEILLYSRILSRKCVSLYNLYKTN